MNCALFYRFFPDIVTTEICRCTYIIYFSYCYNSKRKYNGELAIFYILNVFALSSFHFHLAHRLLLFLFLLLQVPF